MAAILLTSGHSNTNFDGDAAAENLLESLESLAAGNIPICLRNNDEKRRRCLEAMRMASLMLEKPWDTMQRLVFCTLPPNIVQVGINLGLWRLLDSRNDAAMSVSELAVELGTEKALLVRLLRYAATQWMVEQVDVETYRATSLTHHLSMSGIESVTFHVTERNIALYNAIPKWLAENSYKQPQDNKSLPFNLSQNTDLHFFEWLSHRPRHQHAFNEYMSFQRVGQQSWLNVFLFEKYVPDFGANNKQRTVFVDIGGGYGHQCREVLEKHSWLHGHVVLQDTHGAAIDSAKNIRGLKVVHHDFTKPQPIKGAHIYYLRNILHDWPDHACHNILSLLKDVLAPDSVILVDELVLRDDKTHWYGASHDLLMMANYGARERSLAEWDCILDKVGLERKEFVTYGQNGDGVQIIGLRGLTY